MKRAVLGRSGIHVSRLCLGTMMFGSMGNTDAAECTRIIHRAIDAGINFIDTADVYSRGESERIVGDALRGRREKLVVATKFGLPMGADPNAAGSARRWIMRAVDDSLKRLNTDYIDLYQVHRYDPDTDIEELLFALTDLVRVGKIRTFGSSMWSPDRIVEAQWIAEKRGSMRFRCEQPEYSILARDIERYVLPTCERYGIGVIAWSPLNGGFLSGKYRSALDLTPESRLVKLGVRRTTPISDDPRITRKLTAVQQLTEVAERFGISLTRMAIAFSMRHPAVTSSIIGPRTMEQLDDLLPAAEVELTEEISDAIDSICPWGSCFVMPDHRILRASDFQKALPRSTQS